MASNRIMAEEADAKGAFIRHVFHEMRTPLHVLSTFLNSVSPSAEDFEEMRHHTGARLQCLFVACETLKCHVITKFICVKFVIRLSTSSGRRPYLRDHI